MLFFLINIFMLDIFATHTIDIDGSPAKYLVYYEPEPRPLLVALHTWSGDYNQKLIRPYFELAEKNKWDCISPSFESGGSKKSSKAIKAAIDYATGQSKPSKIIIAGMSGGGNAALAFLTHYSDVADEVYAFNAPVDLIKWRDHVGSGSVYGSDISVLCVSSDSYNRARCNLVSLLKRTRTKAAVHIYSGLFDNTVPNIHSISAFKALSRHNLVTLQVGLWGHYDDEFFELIGD